MKRRPVPPSGALRRVDAWARALFPVASSVVLLVSAAVPLGLPGLVPAVALPCVVFWSVFRPAAMPPPAVFGLGLLQDLLTAAPLGSGEMALLVAHGLAVRWRGFLARCSFPAMWLAFCGFAAGAVALGWMLQALLGWRLLPVAPGLHQMVLTAALQPGLTWLLARAHAAMRGAEEAAA